MIGKSAIGGAGPKLMAEWRRDPIKFARNQFGVEPDKWQRRALKALGDNEDPKMRRISMQACVGPGKSALLAWAIWWFMVCFAEPGEHPKGAAVSITGDNLKDNLWAELSKWRARSGAENEEPIYVGEICLAGANG